MKTKTIFYLLLPCLIIICSCKKEEEVPTVNRTEPLIIPRVQGIPMQQTAAAPVQQVVTPTQTTTAPTQQTITQTPVKTAPGMNPPHGQPSHRCDIAVGAPLNSPIKKAAANTTNMGTFTSTKAPTSTTTTTTTTTAPATGTPAILNPNAPAAVVTAPGMNPPHGQTGHRCDVAVGAPLPKT
jgi:hypothetical protein